VGLLSCGVVDVWSCGVVGLGMCVIVELCSWGCVDVLSG